MFFRRGERIGGQNGNRTTISVVGAPTRLCGEERPKAEKIMTEEKININNETRRRPFPV